MNKKSGFTLVELLVVMAIIAMLMAILIPALSRSRRQAQAVICRSNLKQWGYIFGMYTNENNEHFFGGSGEGWWNDWIEILRPKYVKRGGITCCPTATQPADKGGSGIFTAWKDENGDCGSYALNIWVCDIPQEEGFAAEKDRYWRINNIESGGSNIPIFLDSLTISASPDNTSVPPKYIGECPPDFDPETAPLKEQMKPFCIGRHGRGTTNCLSLIHI